MSVTSVVNVTITAISGANVTCTLSMANANDPNAQIVNDPSGSPTLIEVVAAQGIAVQISFNLLTPSFSDGAGPNYTDFTIQSILLSPPTISVTTDPVGILDNNSRDPGIPYTYSMNFQGYADGTFGNFVWDPGVVNENFVKPPRS